MKGRAASVAWGTAILLSWSCGHEEGPGRRAESAVPVEVARVETVQVPLVTRAVGSTESYARAALSTRLMGLVTEVAVEEGQAVRRGQVLVRIENQDLTARQRQAEAGLKEARAVQANAEKAVERLRNLRRQNAVPQQALDEAETGAARALAAVTTAEQAVREIEVNLEYSEVRSPLDGTVVRKQAHAGDLSAPGAPLLEVERLDPIKVTVEVNEGDLTWVAIGQEVEVEIASLRNAPIRRGRVEALNPAADPASRTFRVTVVVPNPDGAIGSGMFARVGFPKGTRPAILVPAAAVVREGQLEGVYLIDGGQARLRWVRLGRAFGDRVEVLSGLEPGQRVAVGERTGLRDGARVEVKGDA
jgi:RND family efflux transporter MFP subunit